MSSNTEELKHRVEAKRKEWEATLARKRADAAGRKSDAAESIQEKLDAISEAVRDGWDNLTDATVAKLNDLLKSDDGNKE